MKGKDIFSTTEIVQFKELIVLKRKSSTSDQKGIRDKMRKIGLYGKDDWGIIDMKVEDLDLLVSAGKINISNEKPVVPVKPVASKAEPKIKVIAGLDRFDISSILDKFKTNCFNPSTLSSTLLPDSPGNYLICLKREARLPATPVKPILQLFDGLGVLYTGIASKSLRKRDYSAHFAGSAGSSTLRKSLGVLYGYKLIKRDANPESRKTKFNADDEAALSTWMHKSLLMFFYVTNRYGDLELKLIDDFNPPLNLKHCFKQENSEFRKMLSALRSQI